VTLSLCSVFCTPVTSFFLNKLLYFVPCSQTPSICAGYSHFLRTERCGRVVSTFASYSAGSRFDLETGYPDWGFRDYPQSLQVNAGMIT
jgi:hypothetical protein